MHPKDLISVLIILTYYVKYIHTLCLNYALRHMVSLYPFPRIIRASGTRVRLRRSAFFGAAILSFVCGAGVLLSSVVVIIILFPRGGIRHFSARPHLVVGFKKLTLVVLMSVCVDFAAFLV